MTDKQKEVLRKIIYAVETGGQVYGQARYDDFTEAYTNSNIEHAITIGAGQWYATEAQRLLRTIYAADKTTWQSLDHIGLLQDVNNADWSCYRIVRQSQKAKLIVKLISTATGRKCQDRLIDEQMDIYVGEAKALGVTAIDAQAMCANFRHQGGYSAMKRVLNKTAKPYTLDNLYTACKTDTGNQVGAYRSRQKMVYNSLKKYMKEDAQMTTAEAINRVIGIAEEEIGYLEKRSNSQLDSKTANAGSNNYTKYWRDVYPAYQAQAWCAAFVSWCFMQAFGQETAEKMLKHWPYVYCPTLGNLFTRYANPQVGDIVIFYRGGTFAHTGIVTKVSGDRFWSIEGNTSGASGIIDNGGGVCEKSYYNSQLPGTKFCRPDYSLAAGMQPGKPSQPTDTGGTYMFKMDTVQKGSVGNHVLLVQEILKARDYKGGDGKPLQLDRECGDNTVYAIKQYQRDRERQSPGICGGVDGVAGSKTLQDMIAL